MPKFRLRVCQTVTYHLTLEAASFRDACALVNREIAATGELPVDGRHFPAGDLVEVDSGAWALSDYQPFKPTPAKEN